jgi:hypothetical protein
MTAPSAVRQPEVVQKLGFGFDPERFFGGAWRRHRDVFTVHVLDDPWTVVADPGAVREAPALLVHRRPDLYPDPWAFRPERFLDRRPRAGEWFPFGGSVRRCIGAAFAQFEARVVLEVLTSALRFTPASRRPERIGRRGPVLVPAKGAGLVAVRRAA